ncbi:MAG: CoA-binding protein [Anaerolineales bacterium]
MNENQVDAILGKAKTIASVGLSANAAKPSHEIGVYLLSQGYTVIPVNPREATILGQTSFPTLDAIPETIDVVQIFRPSQDVPPIVDQAIRIGAKAIWMQQGVVHEGAAATAEAAGLVVVMDRCMRTEHQRWKGAGRRGA